MTQKITKTTTTVTEVIEGKRGPKRTYIALVLDRSSSMLSILNETISGFNENLQAIKQNADLAGETYVTLVTFGGAFNREPIEVEYANKRVDRVQPISTKTYKPQGGTPMLDGIGRAIELLEPFDDAEDDVSFLVMTFSDGEENESKKWKGEKLAAKIQEKEQTGRWTIPLANANVDLGKLAKMTGSSQVASWASTRVGTQTMYDANSYGVKNFMATRGMGGQNVNFYGAALAASSTNSVNLSDTSSLEAMRLEAEENLRKAQVNPKKILVPTP